MPVQTGIAGAKTVFTGERRFFDNSLPDRELEWFVNKVKTSPQIGKKIIMMNRGGCFFH